MKSRSAIASLGLAVFAAITLQADITNIGEFAGDVSDDFGHLAGGSAHPQSVTIFDGNVTASNIHPQGFLAILGNSTRGQTNGDRVIARSAPVMFGQIGITSWEFHTPVSQFGAFFENNSRFDHVNVDFYDVHDNLIGSEVAFTLASSQQWTWNGWHSTTPISRIVTTGNDTDFFGGFVWFDDAQMTFATVPEPAATSALAVISIFFGTLRRKRRQVAMA